MEQYIPGLFVMGVFTLLAGLVVVGATLIHRVAGRVVMALLMVLVLLMGFAPGMHIVIALLSVYALFGCHAMMLPEQRRERAEKAAARHAVASAPAPVPAAPPPTPPANARAALPCPGCGAGARPGGTCAYCGRHV
ncbi:MAG TPA: hypothetical protein VE871_01590 [Longimicrobium sp.]|nr:hypothetical protein [Longimicrobium sp.]